MLGSKTIIFHLRHYVAGPFLFRYGNKDSDLHSCYQFLYAVVSSANIICFLAMCYIDLTLLNRTGLMLGISVAVLDSFCLQHFDSV